MKQTSVHHGLSYWHYQAAMLHQSIFCYLFTTVVLLSLAVHHHHHLSILLALLLGLVLARLGIVNTNRSVKE